LQPTYGAVYISGLAFSAGWNTKFLEGMRLVATSSTQVNVGIGTTTPATSLDVGGQARIYSAGLGTSGSYISFTGINGNFPIIDANGPTDTAGLGLSVLGSTKATISNNGNFGIGTTSPSEKLEINGNCKASSFITTSDYRIKENIQLLNNTYNVDNLRPVAYFNTKSGNKDVGLIAHELQEIYPELVTGEKDGENLQSVNYTGLIPILIKEIQDLKKNNLELTNQLLDLKKIVEKLLD